MEKVNSKIGRPKSTPKVTKSGRFDAVEWDLLVSCFLKRTGLHNAGPSQILNHLALEYRLSCEQAVQAEAATDSEAT